MYFMILLMAIIVAIVLWRTWSRLLAVLVSKVTQRKGVKLNVESLTMRTATRVHVTFPKGIGIVNEIRCRRIQLGWNTCVLDEDDTPLTGLQRFFLILGSCRLHLRFVGVMVRIRSKADRIDDSLVSEDSKESKLFENDPDPHPVRIRTGNMGMLMRTVLPFIYVEVNDFEVYSVEDDDGESLGSKLVKGKTVSLDIKRSNQDLFLENLVICPGERLIKHDQIMNEWGLAEIDSLTITSQNSLHSIISDIMKHDKYGHHHHMDVGRRRNVMKKALLRVHSVRLNVDEKYLIRLRNVMKFRGGNIQKKVKGRGIGDAIHCFLDQPWPMLFETNLKSMTVKLPTESCESQIEFKQMVLSCHMKPHREDEAGKIEFSIVWDKFVLMTAEKGQSAVLECQSSRGSSNILIESLLIMNGGSEFERNGNTIELGLEVDLQALHTKLNHQRIESYMSSALGGKEHIYHTSKADADILKNHVGYRLNLALGNGSSLQFVNDNAVCILHHSIDCASVNIAREGSTLSIKYNVDGIAVAGTENAILKGNASPHLCQVLSTNLFAGTACAGADHSKDLTVSVTSLSAKVSQQLMENICSIAQDVISSWKYLRSRRGVEMHEDAKKPLSDNTSIAVDLLAIDLAIISEYKIEKQFSNINKDRNIVAALASRIEQVSLSKSSTGLLSCQGDSIKILYYEGESVKEFDLNFDLMSSAVHSSPVRVESFAVDDHHSLPGSGTDRKVSVGPTELYGDVDAIMFLLHFSNFVRSISSCFFEEKQKPFEQIQRRPTLLAAKNSIVMTSIDLLIPISSDREIGIYLLEVAASYTMEESKKNACEIKIAHALASVKGVEIIQIDNSKFSWMKVKEQQCVTSTFDSHVETFRFVLPHDRDPGPTMKLCALYIRALKSLVDVLQINREVHAAVEDTTQRTGSSSCHQNRYNITIGSGEFVFEHHPLEQWFSKTLVVRQNANLLEHLWDEAHAAVLSEAEDLDHASPLHSGVQGTPRAVQNPKFVDGQVGEPSVDHETLAKSTDKPWKHLMHHHSKSIIQQLKNLPTSERVCEDIFRVNFTELDISAVENTHMIDDQQVWADTMEFIRTVDEGSCNVSFKSAVLLNVDMAVGDVAVQFGGSNRPLFSGSSISCDGRVAFGKQLSSAPKTCERIVHIGKHHVTTILTPLKGTCPPTKFFTEVSIQMENSSVFFTPGLEPSLGLMGITSKRLIPSDPDFSKQKPPPVPWWDDLRYFWRGKASVQTRNLDVVLMPGTSPILLHSKERLEIHGECVESEISSGKLEIKTGILRAICYRKTLEAEGGTLCAFPIIDTKSLILRVDIKWHLPENRRADDHHIFPHQVGNDCQNPIYVSDIFKSSSFDAVIDVSFVQNSTDSECPKLYIGGEIVSFWRKFMKDWAIPAHIKNQIRRGTYFVKKPMGLKKKGLPRLLHGLKLNISSRNLDLIHFTLDKLDPGGGVVVGAGDGDLKMEWKCNQPISSFLALPPHAMKSNRLETQTKTSLSFLHVRLQEVTVKSLQLANDIVQSPQHDLFRERSSSSGDYVMSFATGTGSEYGFNVCEPHWIAETVKISKSSEESVLPENDPFGTQPMRPLKVKVDKFYFLTDLELRDSIWATVEHLIAAFAPQETPNHKLHLSCRSRIASPMGENESIGMNRMYSQVSENSTENNDLLSLLLQQKEAQDGSPLVSPQSTMDLDKQDSAVNEHDVLPMTTSMDDTCSDLKYEVEVTSMQLALQRDHETGTASGRLLLASKSARLRGMICHQPSISYNITTLDMEDVQAYVSLSSIDPSAQITWLGVKENGEFIAPSLDDHESVWRRIFNPININLRHSKSSSSKHLTSRRASIPSPAIGNAQRQGEELILKIPEIAAVIDGREFEVLIDVVTFLITQGPTIQTCNSKSSLMKPTDNEALDQDRNMYIMAHRQLEAIRNEVNGIVVAMPSLQQVSAWSQAEPLPFSGGFRVPLQISQNLRSNLESQQPSDVLRKFMQKNGASRYQALSQDSDASRILLLQWSLEQEHVALIAFTEAQGKISEAKENLKRQTEFKNSSRVLIQLNRVVWQLCDQSRSPFVQASIKKVMFDRRRNRDRSGSARFTIHRLDILDATGVLPEGPATPAGVILTTWNPESSYEREPVLRIISTLGVPTSKHDVFEHLDATLHPLSLHLTEQIATACWEYFFPKEDQRSRQDAFANSVQGRKIGARSLDSSVQNSPKKTNSGTVKAIGQVGKGDGYSEASSPLVKQESDVSGRSEALYHATPPSARRRDSPIIRKKSKGKRLSKRFKYVKLNRAHMRITYQGKPLGIKDRVLVINSYACENLDGSWRDLLSNVKQKAIFSALFSGLGLQGRKVKELMIGAAPSLSSVEVPSSEEDDHANNRGLLAKFGLRHQKYTVGDVDSKHAPKDDVETQKKRALFGESIVRRGIDRAKGLIHLEPLQQRASSSSSMSPKYGTDGTHVERKHAVPILELTEPLPPDTSSDDSEMSDEEPVSLFLPGEHDAGPLESGLGRREPLDAHVEQRAHESFSSFSKYDPTKPPVLGVIEKDSIEKGNSGPRWMRND